jgi:hypothetical protein
MVNLSKSCSVGQDDRVRLVDKLFVIVGAEKDFVNETIARWKR